MGQRVYMEIVFFFFLLLVSLTATYWVEFWWVIRVHLCQGSKHSGTCNSEGKAFSLTRGPGKGGLWDQKSVEESPLFFLSSLPILNKGRPICGKHATLQVGSNLALYPEPGKGTPWELKIWGKYRKEVAEKWGPFILGIKYLAHFQVTHIWN